MTNEISYTDEEFFRLIAAGDEKAFATLFHKHKQMVYSVALAYSKDRVLSEDILQDVFVFAREKREKLTDIKDISAYLYVTARNRSLTEIKKIAGSRNREDKVMLNQKTWEPDHTEKVSQEKMESLLSEGMELLSPQQRRVFELSRLENLSRDQIADRLGISPNTVKYHLGIALRTVRAFLLANLENPMALLKAKK